jgi:hypothetical protein
MRRNLAITLLSTLSITLVMSGCGDDDNTSKTNEDNTSTRFEQVTMMNDTVERDNQTKLEWVGSSGSMSTACVPHSAATTQEEDIASAKAHCDALVFAGHSDWRVATPAEHATFIADMNSAGKTPFYLNPACPRVIGVDGDNTAKAVNTHNSTPVAAMTPWSTLLTQGATNFGVKCVRDF